MKIGWKLNEQLTIAYCMVYFRSIRFENNTNRITCSDIVGENFLVNLFRAFFIQIRLFFIAFRDWWVDKDG